MLQCGFTPTRTTPLLFGRTAAASVNPDGFFSRQRFISGRSSARFRLSALGFREPPMRKNTDYLFRLKPWSLSAFALALFALLIATTTQAILASFGTTFYFATFFPAIL